MTSVGTQFLTPPAPDEFEVTLFGPGYGEAIACHLGDGRWLLVDSCLDPMTRRPATLEYMRALGQDPSKAVRLVVVSHFDQDHCRGIASVAEEASEARIAVSIAMERDEFHDYAVDPTSREGKLGYRDTREIVRLTDALVANKRDYRWAVSERPLLDIPASERAIGDPLKIIALSPSDAEVQRSVQALGRLALKSGERARRRVSAKHRNHLTVVLWVDLGPVRVLLGGDLEVVEAPNRGWKAVLGLSGSLGSKASLFKIPHHGSPNGYLEAVWHSLLEIDPIALLCPWRNGGRVLPNLAGRRRIIAHTPNAHTTADPQARTSASSLPHVAREVEKRRRLGRLRTIGPPMGAVRARSVLTGATPAWAVEYIAGTAGPLR